MLLDEVGLPLVCGCEGLSAVLLETLGRRASLDSVTGALTVLARLAGHVARRYTTSIGCSKLTVYGFL